MRMGSVPIPPDRSVVLLGLWYWPALKASQVAGLPLKCESTRPDN